MKLLMKQDTLRNQENLEKIKLEIRKECLTLSHKNNKNSKDNKKTSQKTKKEVEKMKNETANEILYSKESRKLLKDKTINNPYMGPQ